MSNKATSSDKAKPPSMKELEDFTRRVLAVPKKEVDTAQKRKQLKHKR